MRLPLSDFFLILHPKGRLLPDQGALVYQYFLKDHLGNTRVLFGDLDGDGKINPDPLVSNDVDQVADYYPFGLQHGASSVMATPAQNYLYNGKEMQDELGLGWYEYGFRSYDPAIVKFTGVDPIAEKFPWVTTYNYAENELIANIDLHGLQKAGMQLVLQKSREHIKNTKSAEDLLNYDNAVKENQNNARIAGAVMASLIIPGPEDVAIGIFMATKLGQYASKGAGILSKWGDDAIKYGKKFFTKGDLGISPKSFDDVTDNTGFSGVMDDATGEFGLFESDTDLIPKYGGHNDVNTLLNEALAKANKLDPGSKRTGFTVIKQGNNLEVRFNSRSVNGPNHNLHTAPYEFQKKVFDAVKNKYGDKFKVIPDTRPGQDISPELLN
ncbi:MAG: RHS repeat-associated core domain-containing protein [Bacteroidota bacterium]